MFEILVLKIAHVSESPGGLAIVTGSRAPPVEFLILSGVGPRICISHIPGDADAGGQGASC